MLDLSNRCPEYIAQSWANDFGLMILWPVSGKDECTKIGSRAILSRWFNLLCSLSNLVILSISHSIKLPCRSVLCILTNNVLLVFSSEMRAVMLAIGNSLANSIWESCAHLEDKPKPTSPRWVVKLFSIIGLYAIKAWWAHSLFHSRCQLNLNVQYLFFVSGKKGGGG